MSDPKPLSGEETSGEASASVEGLWAEALDQQQLDQQQAADHTTESTNAIFKPLDTQSSAGNVQDIDLILDIPVKLTVELGRTKMTIKELLRLSQGSVVALDGLAGEPLDVLINGYLIAQGEVVVVGDKFGVRITDIITPSERMRRLSR
jgi:flagellar motor switch protein FliN